MKCPHCPVTYHDAWNTVPLGTEDKLNPPGMWQAQWQTCPACQRITIVLERFVIWRDGAKRNRSFLVYPKGGARPVPPEVALPYRQDFNEACAILNDSPKSSAAISRQCLQLLFKTESRTAANDLAGEIDELLDSKVLPSYLAESLDAIRKICDFTAHPIKSTNPGTIVDASPGEAEWLVDVLEGLFDFYFVQPALLQKKRDVLNQRLKEVGRPASK